MAVLMSDKFFYTYLLLSKEMLTTKPSHRQYLAIIRLSEKERQEFKSQVEIIK